MNSEATRTNVEVVEAWPRYFSAHDVDGLVSLYTENAVYEDVPWGHTWRGKTQVRAMLQGFFRAWSDLKMQCTSTFRGEDRAAIEWLLTGTQLALPNKGPVQGAYSLRGVTIIELQDGKIRHSRDYWDYVTLLRQVGLLPE
jgi:steroid delta-isomerase-like uncharacterized protein